MFINVNGHRIEVGDFDAIFRENAQPQGPEVRIFASELAMQATAALAARASADPRWPILVYRLQCWGAQRGSALTEAQVAAKLEALAAAY